MKNPTERGILKVIFKILWLRPGNFGWTSVAMLLLHPDLSVRGFGTAWLINKSDECDSGCQRIKNYLPGFAAPNFDDVRLHRVRLQNRPG